MIADSHCHAWRVWPYDRRVPDPEHRGTVDALLWQMDTHGVAHAAVVCARIGGGNDGAGFANADNNAYVVDAARRYPHRLTAWVDVDSMWRAEHHTPGAARRVADVLEETGAPGVTHYVRPENDGWFRSEDGHAFVAEIAARGAVLSLAAGAAWLPDVVEIARRHPSLVVLLHHLGLPRQGRHREQDVNAVLTCAEVPNIGVKASGFHYNDEPAWGYPYPAAQQLFQRLLDGFGPCRLLWGSDFPASRDLLTYRQSIEVVRAHAGLSTDELDLVMGGNLDRLLRTGSLT
ncbi:amidohydrolase family protein [Pseudactinotalea terrae]|uniref:amidohydrolase family protein n=1 Tax=Pseudactinotalea terrae TaxID=1743262 RepID=UPI0012E1FC97|nr:amidohydrolase family protein [Pseudactinotalea terrae]